MDGLEERTTMRFDTYCGLYCGACEVLIANAGGAIEEKAGSGAKNRKTCVATAANQP